MISPQVRQPIHRPPLPYAAVQLKGQAVQHNRPLLAIALRLGSALGLATMLALVKLAGQSGVALPEIMFWRQAVTIPVVLLSLAATGRLANLRTQRIGSQFRRAMSGMFGMACNFGASILLPLAVSTTLNFTTPLFAVIIGALVLHHKIGRWRWASVLLGFAGVIVIAQPGHSGGLSTLGMIAGLTSGFMIAIISYQLRDLGKTEHPIATAFYFALFGAPLMALFLPFCMTSHNAGQWALLVGVGLSGTLTQVMLSASLRYGSVASVLVMDYSVLIWSSLYGWLVWNHLPTTATWLGAPLIVGAGLIIGWREHRALRVAREEQATPAEALAAAD